MSDSSGWKAGELADTLRAGDFEASIDGVLSDDEIAGDALLRLEQQGLDDGPLAQLLAKQTSTDMLRSARQHSDVASMSAATGLSDSTVDVSDWEQIQVVQDLFRKTPRVKKELTNTVFQCVLFSPAVPPTGRGKTSTAYWLCENAEIVDPDINIVTNNPSDEYPNVPEQWDDLKTEIRENDGWSLLMLDEAAQFLQYADQGAGKDVSQMMKLLRHNKCHLILVGHTGADVPKDIRRQMFFIGKPSKKSATIGYGLENRGDGRKEVRDPILQMSGVPHTSVSYESQGEEAIEIQFDSDDDSDDSSGREPVSCRGEKTTGGDCGATVNHISGYCYQHRDQWDEETPHPQYDDQQEEIES